LSAAAKSLGLGACTALVVGNMVGSGVFALPASLAPFGGIALGGWLVTSAGSIALALVFGRLARLVPATGGPYAYTRAGFGDFAGFLVAWGYWITLWSGNAAVAVALSGYLAYFLPILREQPVAGLAAALGAIWLVTLINVRGVKEAGLFQVATTILKLVPLLLTATVGLAFVAPSHFVPLNTSGLGTFGALAACSAQTLWAFLGLESATVPAGDVDRPEVTIPRATVLGTSFAAVLYILVTVAVFGIVPLGDLAHSSAPLADAAERVFGPWAGSFVALGAVVSTIGTLNGFTMLSGQVPLGAARDQVFPARFGTLSPQGTPAFALIASNLLASVLVALNFTKGMGAAFTFITLLATLAALVPYAFCALVELMLFVRDPRHYRGGSHLGRTVALASVAFLYAMGAIYGAGPEVVFYGFLLLLAGVPIFVWVRWRALAPDLATARQLTSAIQ
jgi:APA family basic amino acid/polyamine antiporter